MNRRSEKKGVWLSRQISLRLIAFCVALFLFSGCENERELISGLSFKQLTEVSVALNDAGIFPEIRKSGSQGSERYALLLSESMQAQAIRVLKEYNLPRQEQEMFKELSKDNPFLPESRELSQLRRDRALSLELENFLSGFAGVLEARVVLRNQQLSVSSSSQVRTPPSATVLIKALSKALISEVDVRTAVMKVLPEIAPNDISLIVSEINQRAIPALDEKGQAVALVNFYPFPFSVRVNELGLARKIIACLLLLFIGAGILVGYVISRWYRPKVRKLPRVVRTAVIETSLRPLPFERKGRDNPRTEKKQEV